MRSTAHYGIYLGPQQSNPQPPTDVILLVSSIPAGVTRANALVDPARLAYVAQYVNVPAARNGVGPHHTRRRGGPTDVDGVAASEVPRESASIRIAILQEGISALAPRPPPAWCGASTRLRQLVFQPEEAFGVGVADLFAGVVVDRGVVEPGRGLVHRHKRVVH